MHSNTCADCPEDQCTCGAAFQNMSTRDLEGLIRKLMRDLNDREGRKTPRAYVLAIGDRRLPALMDRIGAYQLVQVSGSCLIDHENYGPLPLGSVELFALVAVMNRDPEELSLCVEDIVTMVSEVLNSKSDQSKALGFNPDVDQIYTFFPHRFFDDGGLNFWLPPLKRA